MSLLKQVGNTSGVEMFGVVTFPDGKTIEIVGEVHGEENKFCEELIAKGLLQSYEVFCEHATVLCRLNPEEHDRFKASTGSEYIFYNLMKDGQKPICFDNRIESGLPSRIEENALVQFFQKGKFDDKESLSTFRVILSRLTELYEMLLQMKPIFSAFYNEQYEIFINCITVQYNILLKSLSKGASFLKGKGFFIPKVPNSSVISRVGVVLCSNIMKLCSAFVDVHLFRLLAKSSAKKIVVFCGASHAFRLLTIVLAKRSEIMIDVNDRISDKVKFIPEGTFTREVQFLQALED